MLYAGYYELLLVLTYLTTLEHFSIILIQNLFNHSINNAVYFITVLYGLVSIVVS